MLINVYGGNDDAVRIAADIAGANLFFRWEETYRVTVYVDGYKVGETRKHMTSREWVNWLRSL